MATHEEKIVITREMVFDEAGRLKASGVDPTNRKLLQELGGSMTTIAGFLRDWIAQQSIAAPAQVDIQDVPAGVVDAGKQAVCAIWQACHAEARREIEAVTEKTSQRVDEVETDRDRVLTELAEAEAEMMIERARAAALDSELTALREAHVAMQGQNQHLLSEVQKAKAVAQEIERRAGDLDANHKHERDRADKLAQEFSEIVQASNKLAGQVETLQQQTAEQTAMLRALTPKSGRATGAT
jgi:predicted nuclease with TOPRIM domain